MKKHEHDRRAITPKTCKGQATLALGSRYDKALDLARARMDAIYARKYSSVKRPTNETRTYSED